MDSYLGPKVGLSGAIYLNNDQPIDGILLMQGDGQRQKVPLLGSALKGFLCEGIFLELPTWSSLSLRPTDWSVCVGGILCVLGMGQTGSHRLGEVTGGLLLPLQVHCGQLSDSEECSLQAVEKHVSGVVPWEKGQVEDACYSWWQDDLARALGRPGSSSSSITFELGDPEPVA